MGRIGTHFGKKSGKPTQLVAKAIELEGLTVTIRKRDFAKTIQQGTL